MMEQDLPIDIQTGKLVDWLVSRRHVKKNWPEAIQVVREKINNAIQDMPEHPEITKLLSGSYINYFHCLQIINILRETEKESKNIFGWYTSQRMKDWQEVINLYEADNVNLAEASNFLVRNVNYEIPSLKKQISKCRQIQEECEKKNSDIIKRSATAKDKYLSACKKIEISGDNAKEELLSLLDKLPERLSSIGEKVKVLSEARDYYQDFIHFIVSPKQSCLPLLKFLIERGDVTFYEWKYGEPPVSIERKELSFQISKEEESVVSDEIDFGDCGEAAIDFGEDVQLETGDIDWGNLDDQQDLTAQIDFGDDIGTSEIVVESTGLEGGVAKGPEALSLLFTEETRNQVINELMELEGFLSQRMVELETEENVLSMSLFTNSPRSLQYQSVEGISKHLGVVSEITQDLTSTKMQHLFMIGTSPRYVDRLVESLQRHLRDRDRLLASVESIKQKSSEASQQQHVLSKHLQLIVARSKELQENVEKLISKKYKDRVVNLMGGIQHI